MNKRVLFIFIIILIFPLMVFAENNYTIDNLETTITINDKEIKYIDKFTPLLTDDKVVLEKKVNKLYYNGNKNAITDIIVKSDKEQNHTIDYTLPLAKKYNDIALGNDYNAIINRLSFIVTLNVDYKKIHFLLNGKDITNNDNLKYNINNNTITGEYRGKLEPNDNLVITLKDEEEQEKILSYIGFFVPPICLLIGYIIWLLYGKDLKNLKINKITIPEKNPLEVSYMYNNTNNKEDYIDMLIYFANKGLIKISNNNNRMMIENDKKVKTHNKQEIALLNEMFKKEEEISINDYIKMLPSLEIINKKVSDELNLEQKYFERRNVQRIIIVLLMAITLLTITVIPFITLSKPQYIAIPTIFSIIILYIIINIIGKNKITAQIINKITILFIIVFLAWLIIIRPMDFTNITNIASFMIGIIITLIMTIFYKYMPKRTKYGVKELSKIESLKDYIEKIDTMDLEKNLKENPNYIYDILPYCYITGESDILIEKATMLKAKKPKWLDDKNEYDINKFNEKIQKLFKRVNSK